MRILALPAAALLALCLYLPLPRLAEALAAAPHRLRALLSRRIPEARAALALTVLLPAGLAAVSAALHPAAAALTMAPLLAMPAVFPGCARLKDELDAGTWARDIPAYEARVREACLSLAPAFVRGGVQALLLLALGTALHVGGALGWALLMLRSAEDSPAAKRVLDAAGRAADAVACALLLLCACAVGRNPLRTQGRGAQNRLIHILGIAGDGTDTHAPVAGDIAQGIFLCCLCAALLLLLLTLVLLAFA